MRIKTVEIADDVADVLRRATIEPRALIINDPELPKPLYQRIDKVLKALGGKWNGSARAHLFPEGALDQLGAALAAGHVVDQKRTMEQFFTPAHIAQQMAQLADIRCSESVLEPSAGGGALVIAALEMAAYVKAVEMDTVLAAALPDKVEAHFCGKHCPGTLAAIECRDFMQYPPGAIIADKVLMNPPFSGGQDMAHVQHALTMINPGGRLVSIMSTHWTFATDRKAVAFRDWLRSLGGDDWLDLPEGTFKESGTGVNTGILMIEKPR